MEFKFNKDYHPTEIKKRIKVKTSDTFIVVGSNGGFHSTIKKNNGTFDQFLDAFDDNKGKFLDNPRLGVSFREINDYNLKRSGRG